MTKTQNLTSRLASSRGRFVGITTVTRGQTRRFNGQVRSVTNSYVTVYDRNKQEQFKLSLKNVQSVTGV